MDVGLVTFRADGQRCDLQIRESVTTLGRHEDCEIQIPHPHISRRHAQILLEGENLKIKDLGSSNGTFVNDQRIVEMVLAAGDRLRLAEVVFTVVIDGAPAEIAKSITDTPSDPPATTPPPPPVEEHVEPTIILIEPPEPPAANDPLAALAAMSKQPQQ